MFGFNSCRDFKLHFRKHRNPGDIDEKTVLDAIKKLKEEFLIQTTTQTISSNLTETDSTSSSVKSSSKNNILRIVGILVAVLLVLAAISILYTFMGRKRKVKKLAQEKECEKNERKRKKGKPVRSKKVVVQERTSA